VRTCHRCLSATKLPWREVEAAGELISQTAAAHSNDLFFRERLPWRLGMVKLDAGRWWSCTCTATCAPPPPACACGARLDGPGWVCWWVFLRGCTTWLTTATARNDLRSRAFRKVLITDGKTAVGQAMVRALVAGRGRPDLGRPCEPWKQLARVCELAAIPQVTLVPLDLTNELSVREMAGEIGARKVDILINTAEVPPHHGIARGRAPKWRGPRWTSTTSACCAWRRSSAR
jgi:hypothetical protein